MKKVFTRVQQACGVAAVAFSFYISPQGALAQISMGKFNTTYNQNFNGLPVSGTGTWEDGAYYLPGWTVKRTVANSIITANTGASNAAALYSYGSAGSSDRALGSVSSIPTGSRIAAQFAYGILLQNNAGTSVTSLDISFFGEQWRVSNSTAPQHRIEFSYAISSDPSTFNLSPANTNWTVVPELDFWGPKYKTSGGAMDGNLPENKRFLAAKLPVIIPDGYYLMLRWVDYDELEADHGLAIDDVSISWSVNPSGPGILPVELVEFTAKTTATSVALHWSTATELNNDYFTVERSNDAHNFLSIGQVTGQGNSKVRSTYTYQDKQPLPGTSYYRLKQVDTDGSFSYSNVVVVERNKGYDAVKVYPTITADYLQLELNEEENKYTFLITDQQGRLVLEQHPGRADEPGKLDVRHLPTGAYILRLQHENEVYTSRFVKF